VNVKGRDYDVASVQATVIERTSARNARTWTVFFVRSWTLEGKRITNEASEKGSEKAATLRIRYALRN
jgi:hypothetical protein